MLKNRAFKKAAVLIWFIVPVFCANCGPKRIEMSSQGHRLLKSENNTWVVYHNPPAFAVMTTGKAMFGAIGGAAMVSAGNKMRQKYGLIDPTIKVKENFKTKFENRLSLKSLRVENEPLSKDSIEDLRKKFRSGLVLDFKTHVWSFGYYAADWKHYRLSYSVRARLIELRNSKLVWQGICNVFENEPKGERPTLKELKADEGALIKAKLADAAQYCTEDLLKQFFNGEEI